MIISHKYKFIFIKTIKTAGTSIEVFLSQYCDESDVVTPIFPAIEEHEPRNFKQHGFYNHMPARQVRQKISPQIWNDYYKFCVERNPWDKTLSHYYMERHREGGSLSLESYLERQQFCFNHPLYTTQSGQVIVDKIIAYENLTAELAKVFNKLGIPFNGHLGIRAKSEYRLDKRHYSEVLSAQQAAMIMNAFQKEIKMHKYKY